MAADLERAYAFVAARATPVERARLRFVLAHEPPPAEVVQAVTADQRPDGGWAPFWSPEYSSLDATCFRLAQAEQTGIPLDDGLFQHAGRFLLMRQRPDGSWEEDESVRDLAPPWARPDDAAARLYVTASCALWCALLGAKDAAQRGTTVLEGEIGAEGRLPSFLQAQWLGAGLVWRLGRGRQVVADRLLAYLATRLSELPASSLTWLLSTLLLAGVPADRTIIQDAATLLEGMQRADGGWPSDEGADLEVHVTLEALRALRPYTPGLPKCAR
jgi:hypothetical protein